jgi:AraC-like DNA-binding protein
MAQPVVPAPRGQVPARGSAPVRRAARVPGRPAPADAGGTGTGPVYGLRMEAAELGHLRRARDLLDREYARPLNVPVMARAALMSPSLFSRRFREAYGDTPYGYLQARRVERAMALLRGGAVSVTDACLAVGFTSLGSFSSTFTRLVGEPPSAYKARDHSRLAPVPPCMTRAWARPGWIAEPCRIGEAFPADRA